jgi:rod shape determining protein RodA
VNPLAALYDFFFLSRDRLGKTRALLLFAGLALTGIGVAFIQSTSPETEGFLSDKARDQLAKAGVGFLLMLAVIAFDYRLIERIAYLVYAGLVAVLAVLLVVKRASGEELMRWVQIGFLNIQPSELMKISLVLALARYLKFRSDLRSLAGLIAPFLLTMVPFFLVVAQPNLGTALMLPPILLAMLFIGGARRLHLLSALLAGALLFPALLLANHYLPQVSTRLVKDYQVRRLTAFLQRDEKTEQTAGYQLRESLIAFRDGGLTGTGFGQGPQNNLDFLPAKHTDFIFPVIGEEWGFLGAASVVFLFFSLVVLCLRVALRTREPFGRLVASAIAVGFAAQGLENFGMTLGLTPITGVPLPFVSFGGSSLVTSCLALGLVLNVGYRRVRVMASQDLNPIHEERVLLVIDEHPAGAQRFR